MRPRAHAAAPIRIVQLRRAFPPVMALSVANPIAAAVRGHRPVDSPAGDRSADRTGSDAKQAVSDQAVTDEAAGHAARYQTGRTGRIAANLVIIARTAGI